MADSTQPRISPVGLPALALYLILAIWLAALGFRVLYVTQINPDPDLTGDGVFYHGLANDLADGEGFRLRRLDFSSRREVADHPPGYPVLLSLASRAGLDSLDDHRLVTALVGSLSVPLLGLAAGRLAGAGRRDKRASQRLASWAAVSAAVLAALDVNMWVWDPLLLAEPLVLVAAAAWLYSSLVYDDRPSLVAAGAMGLTLGVAAATRSEVLLAALVVPVLLWRHRALPWTRLALHGAVAGAATAVVLGPWVWTNLHRFEEPVIMTTGLGNTLVQANCDAAFYGPATGYSDYNCFSRTRSLVSPEMDESEKDVLFRRIGLDYIKDHPTRFPVVATARLARTFGLFRPVQQVGYMEGVELRGPHPVVWAGVVSWQLLMPLGIAGVVLARREGTLIAPVVAVAAAVVLAVALTQGSDRYRMALEPLLIAYAGLAVARGLAVVGRSTPALKPTGLGRWLRKWSPRPDPPAEVGAP
ncbi:MAG: hypothetical protein R2754_03175 [Microthrixaceae bacterium]